jgi:thiosulfate dehydrogenase
MPNIEQRNTESHTDQGGKMSEKSISGNLRIYAVIILIISVLLFMYACSTSSVRSSYSTKERAIAEVIDGGRLYDKWWIETAGGEEPKEDHPLWKLQTTNKRKGSATWRCKECHGWDYMGKDGVYGSGSHKTGFPGILSVRNKSIEEIESILRGSTNPDHNFTTVLDYDSISRLAVFIKKGLIDLRSRIDYETKRPVMADAENGKKLFNDKCIKCHNEKGNELNFGSEDKKEYIGTIANDNPWELVHKVRFGEPGEIMPSLRTKLKLSDQEKRMPSGIETGYIISDVMDILEYSRSLPTE